MAKFNARANVSASIVKKRFGGLQGTLRKYREWLGVHAPDSPLLLALHAKSKHEIVAPPQQLTVDQAKTTWAKMEGTEFGHRSTSKVCAMHR